MKKIVLCVLICILSVSVFAKVKFNGSFANSSGITVIDGKPDFTNISQLGMKLQNSGEGWRLFSDIKLSAYSGFDDAIIDKDIELDIARLYIKTNLGPANIILGRDYLSFGTPFIFNTLEWTENSVVLDQTALKPAINLVSATLPIGAFGKFAAFVGGNDDMDVPLAGSELVLGTSGFEGGLTYQHKDWHTHIVGGFIKADLGVSLVATYAAHLQNVIVASDKFNHSHEVGLGVDYSFPINYSSLLVSQSFYFNSEGEKYHSYSSLALTIDDFSSCGVDCLLSLTDFSGSVMPRYGMILLDGLDLNFGMGINFGKENSELFINKMLTPRIAGMVKVTAKF